jgi:hypothetical protein
LVDEREIAFEDVEVGAAYPAGEDAEEDVAFGDGGDGYVFKFEGVVGGMQDGGFHRGLLVVKSWMPAETRRRERILEDLGRK